MKQFLIPILISTSLALASCNNDSGKKKENMTSTNSDRIDTTMANTAGKDVKQIARSFDNLDPNASEAIKAIVSHYLHVKNALANDNANDAAQGAKSMADALTNIDKSFFTPEQKKIYDQTEDKLKQHTQHISKSNVHIQREHFSMMSEDMHSLVKSFGGGQTLYYDYCPMANDGKGAMWLSEAKEIKNPYMGSKMPTCGSVKEQIQ